MSDSPIGAGMLETQKSESVPMPGRTRQNGSVPTLGRAQGRVLRWLEDAIASGELPGGAAIPSERALAEKLGVARNTVASALDEAERLHLAARRAPGARKRFVPDGTNQAPAPLSSSTVIVMGALDPFTDGHPAPRWSDRFLSINLLGTLTRAGRHVMVLNNESLNEKAVDGLFMAPPAGMVITSTIGEHPLAHRAMKLCRARGVPLVVYGDSPELSDCDRVYTDHRAGARDLARWLLGRGCRRVVPFFPCEPVTWWARERVAGVAEAMREAGLDPLPAVSYDAPPLKGMFQEERFRIFRALALTRLLELRAAGGFDALVCLTDHWAKPVIAALRDLGLRPGRDVLVTGFDNVDPDPDFGPFEPERPSATIDKHNEKTAEDMAELLVARMDGHLPPGPQCRTHPHELVILS